MTIASRRFIYWALFGLSNFALATGIILAFPLFLGEVDMAVFEPFGGNARVLFLGLTFSVSETAVVGLIVTCLLSAAGLLLVLSFFRKTVSSEVFFFSFWLLSIGFEVGRLLVFRLAAGGASMPWIMLATRFVLASRYVGYLSLFAAGLYASGFHNEKLGSVIFMIIAIGGALAAAMPLNTGVYDSSFLLKAGYGGISASLFWLAGGMTALNFLYAARQTREKSYRVAALGVVAFVLGRRLMLMAYNPLATLLGALLLAVGTWLFVSRLHAYYLWQ